MMRARIIRARLISPTLRHLVLRGIQGELPPAAPGSHVAVRMSAFARAYSLVRAEPGSHEIVVRRAPASRGGSAALHVLPEGATLEVEVPVCGLPLMRTARHHLMIAGGIGVTPFLGFLPALRGLGAAWSLHHVAAPADHRALRPFLDASGGAIHRHAHRNTLDAHTLLARAPLGTHLYLCGPDAMAEAIERAALGRGWPRAAVHRERFAADPAGVAFEARLARSGRTIAVAAGVTLLEALEHAGLALPHQCRAGACGACRVGLLGGDAEHRDHVLDPAQRETSIMPCVSRAASFVSLDL